MTEREETRTAEAETARRRAAARGEERRGTAWVLFTTLMQASVGTLLHRGGAASWWLLPLCLLPAAAAFGAGRLLMGVTGAPTLDEAFRASLGGVGAALWKMWLAVLLLYQAESALSGLCSLYAEGVDMSVSALGVAAAALVSALACGGLTAANRCTALLTGVAAVVLAIMTLDLLGLGRADHFLPMASQEAPARLLWRLNSLGWPLLLLLRTEAGGRRAAAAATGIAPAWVLTAVLVFALPPQLFMGGVTLAERMLMAGGFMTPLHRELSVVAWTVGLLVTVMVCLWSVAELTAGQRPRRTQIVVAGVAACVLWAAHFFGEAAISAWLTAVRPWLLAPFALLTVCGLGGAAGRRKHGT